MKKLTISLLLTLNIFFVHGQEMSKDNQKVVSDFIDCIKHKKKDQLLKRISFPFSRQYPLPEIKNRQEFLNRYDEVFDDSLTKMIISSNPSADWSEMGWRGIMLLNGDLWLDYDGRLIAINYQSKAEKKKRTDLVSKEKSKLYESIKVFEQPIYILETKHYRIRIDDLGQYNYRFTSWHLNSKMSDKPDIIIEKGEFIPEGSGGNCRYEFKNGKYTYECSIIVIGENDSPPASLTIYKDSTQILFQEAKIISN